MGGDGAFDVVCVGGGVGGSAVAAVMAAAGCSCLVLERSSDFPDRTRGEWIAPWGVAEARRCGLEEVVRSARGHTVTRHISYDEDLTRAECEAAELPLGLMVPGVDGPLTQRHPDLCQALFEAAGARGAATRRGVEDVVVTPGTAPLVAYTVDGRRHEVACRLVVAADGRNSVVRRSLGLELDRSEPHHLFSGLLVDGADGLPADLQVIGTEGTVHYLAFPQGQGRVRLYLGFGFDDRHRFTGPDGARAFLDAFALDSLPYADTFVRATPVSPHAVYPNEDASVPVPVVPGVVLVGDAAGWNDPITGQGLSITLRDVRVVTELLRAGADWSAGAFTPYVEERAERMRRLRFGAQLQSVMHNEFGPAAIARRQRMRALFAEDPMASMPLAATMMGPEVAPPEVFTPEAWARLVA